MRVVWCDVVGPEVRKRWIDKWPKSGKKINLTQPLDDHTNCFFLFQFSVCMWKRCKIKVEWKGTVYEWGPPFTPKFTAFWRGSHSSKHFRKSRSSEHTWYGVGAAWLPSSLTLFFICKQPRREQSGRIAYLTLLADMPFTLGKINETKPTSTSTCNIPGFKVSMYYSNTMKVLYQLIYLGSAGNRVSSITITPGIVATAAYRSGALSSPHWFRMPSHKSRMRTSTRLPLNAP